MNAVARDTDELGHRNRPAAAAVDGGHKRARVPAPAGHADAGCGLLEQLMQQVQADRQVLAAATARLAALDHAVRCDRPSGDSPQRSL